MAAKIDIEVDEITLKRLVVEYLQRKMGDIKIDENDVYIETKSKQNYRSEWEVAAFRAKATVRI